MSLLEERMYGFITQPDNWQVAREISEKMEYVKDRMLKEFWGKVKSSIESKLDVKEWNLTMSENIYDANSVLEVTHKSWEKLFGIGFQYLHSNTIFGIYRDFDSKKVPDALHEQIAINLKTIYKQMDKSDWWPGCYCIGDDFREGTTLCKILPSNRQALVDKYSNMLLDLKDKAEPIIDEAMTQIATRA